MADSQLGIEEIPEKTYYRIGEVAEITDVKPYVLRFWESEFKVMTPPKSRSKQRMYRRKDIDTILLIKKLLYEQGYTIKGARKKLPELLRDGAAQAELLKAPPHEAFRKIRRELEKIRALLGPEANA